MNERTQRLALLAEQAIRETDLTEVNGGIHITPAFEKFAELIVKECLNEIQSLLDCNTQVDEFEQGVYNGIDMAKDCIKEHFGVKE